jgi:hypothetical protein
MMGSLRFEFSLLRSLQISGDHRTAAQQHGSNHHVSAKQQQAQPVDKSKAAHEHSTAALKEKIPAEAGPVGRLQAQPRNGVRELFDTRSSRDIRLYKIDHRSVILVTAALAADAAMELSDPPWCFWW